MHKKLIILLFMIWFFIFFILPFFSKTIGSDINKIYSVLIFIFFAPYLSYFLVTKKYTFTAENKIATPLLDKIIGTLLYMPLAILLYDYNLAFVYSLPESINKLNHTQGVIYQYAPSRQLSTPKCLQNVCLYFKDGNDKLYAFDCAIFNKSGCLTINKNLFSTNHQSLSASIRYINLEGIFLLYELTVDNQNYTFDYFKQKYHTEKFNGYINFLYYIFVSAYGYFILKKLFQINLLHSFNLQEKKK